MADKGIKEGDTVSWKWGSGKPSGVVEEVKTSGQLEIETAGKKVRKNADEDNPAVHVAREGNDVVKRASELTKKSDGEDVEMKDREREKKWEEKKEEEKEEKESEKEVSGKSAGEKRDRDDTVEDGEAAAGEQEIHAAVEEQEDAEEETGKGAKKPKLDTDEEKSSEEKEKKGKASPPKKKAGRVVPKAKKSEDSKPAIFHDTPAARTRSKATA